MAQPLNINAYRGASFSQIQQAISPSLHLITPEQEAQLRMRSLSLAVKSEDSVALDIDDVKRDVSEPSNALYALHRLEPAQ